jgi:serralysin
LATLKYSAGTADASLTVDIWDQAGVEGLKAFEVTVSAASSGGGSTGSGGSGGSSGSGGTSGSTPDPVVTVPASETVAASATIAISGASIADAWAATASGSLALNITATRGTVTMLNASGAKVAGSGTSAIHVSGTLAQINAELATLTYKAGSSTGSGSVTVDIWDQAGMEATKSVAISITKAVTTNAIAASVASSTETVSGAVITAAAGDHAILIDGANDTLTATGGTETVQAYQGGNTITTGAGNDTIRFARSDNVINAGGGSNRLFDSGSNNTIVLGSSGGYDDIYGSTLQNGDRFDLRSLLAQTAWNGDLGSIGGFLRVGVSGNNGVLSIDPTGVTGGASSVVATFEASGAINLSTLLAHSIT